MTLTEMKLALTKKFPQFLKADDTELEDIADAMNGFSEADIQTIWVEFKDTYAAGFAPRRAVFVKLAKELGIRRVSTATQASYEYACLVCASRSSDYRFPFDAPKCPRCGNRFSPHLVVIKSGGWVSKERALQALENFKQGADTVYSRPSIGVPTAKRILDDRGMSPETMRQGGLN